MDRTLAPWWGFVDAIKMAVSLGKIGQRNP
jgi:hypothetical protein